MVDASIQNVDVTVVGAGIVGLAIANLLKDLPLSLAIIEAHNIPDWDADDYGLRVSAISKASETVLSEVGVWNTIQNKRVSPYTDMRVWETALNGQDALHFSAAQSALPNIGHIIENALIRSELFMALREKDKAKLHWYMPDKLDAIETSEQHVSVHLHSGQQLQTKLLIAADGASSITRKKLGVPTASRSYEQHGMVAHLKLEKSHQQTAYQRFFENDILAFLPLVDEHEVSMVWSLAKNKAEQISSLDKMKIETELTELMQVNFGQVTLLSELKSFPLQLLHSRHYVSERVVLCGDAAHAVHPLAGQGVNLGLLDAKVLSTVLHQAWQKNYDLGDLTLLRQYERERKAGNVRMMSALDGLFSLFQSQESALLSMRRFGMGMVNRVKPLKHELMQHALGLR